MTFRDHLEVTNVKIAYTFIGERWSMLAIRHEISLDDLDLKADWFGAMSRSSQQELGFFLWNILLTWYMKFDNQRQIRNSF